MMPRPSRRAVLGGLATATFIDLGKVRAQPVPDEALRTLEARPGEIALLPEGKTVALTFDGAVPGPLLRAKHNDEVRLRLLNKLDQPTSLHWHGLRGFNTMDGVGGLTQKPVLPGASFDIAFKATDPGFLLYRPATLPHATEQIARGLAGALIVDEAQPPDVDADQMLLLQDWTLDTKDAVVGPFDDPAQASGAGRLGTTLTIGAKPVPFRAMLAPGARLRLRLGNAATARIIVAVFSGLRPKIIAIDGQPCDPFEPVRQTIPIAPGARFDLLMDMPADEKAQAKLTLRDPAGGTLDADLAVWTTQGAPAKARGAIASLALNPLLPAEIRLAQAKKLELTLEPPKAGKTTRWTINGAARSYADKPILTVPRNTPVSIGFTSKAAAAIPMCVHGHAVRLLHDLDDGWEPYWRNGVIVPGNRTKHVAFLAEAPGKWALRSEIAEQEAAGLATWFEVT